MAIDRKWSVSGIQKQTWHGFFFFCFASHPTPFSLLVLIKLLSIRSIVNCIWRRIWHPRGCKLRSDSCSLLRRLTTRRFGFAFGRLKLRPGRHLALGNWKFRAGAKCQSASSHTHTTPAHTAAHTAAHIAHNHTQKNPPFDISIRITISIGIGSAISVAHLASHPPPGHVNCSRKQITYTHTGRKDLVLM